MYDRAQARTSMTEGSDEQGPMQVCTTFGGDLFTCVAVRPRRSLRKDVLHAAIGMRRSLHGGQHRARAVDFHEVHEGWPLIAMAQ